VRYAPYRATYVTQTKLQTGKPRVEQEPSILPPPPFIGPLLGHRDETARHSRLDSFVRSMLFVRFHETNG
jgi:hypothetical protein